MVLPSISSSFVSFFIYLVHSCISLSFANEVCFSCNSWICVSVSLVLLKFIFQSIPEEQLRGIDFLIYCTLKIYFFYSLILTRELSRCILFIILFIEFLENAFLLYLALYVVFEKSAASLIHGPCCNLFDFSFNL